MKLYFQPCLIMKFSVFTLRHPCWGEVGICMHVFSDIDLILEIDVYHKRLLSANIHSAMLSSINLCHVWIAAASTCWKTILLLNTWDVNLFSLHPAQIAYIDYDKFRINQYIKYSLWYWNTETGSLKLTYGFFLIIHVILIHSSSNFYCFIIAQNNLYSVQWQSCQSTVADDVSLDLAWWDFIMHKLFKTSIN